MMRVPMGSPVDSMGSMTGNQTCSKYSAPVGKPHWNHSTIHGMHRQTYYGVQWDGSWNIPYGQKKL